MHITQNSALSVPLALDFSPVMPVKSLPLSQKSKPNHTTEEKSHPITVTELPKKSVLTFNLFIQLFKRAGSSLESGRAEETKKCHVTFSLAGVILPLVPMIRAEKQHMV